MKIVSNFLVLTFTIAGCSGMTNNATITRSASTDIEVSDTDYPISAGSTIYFAFDSAELDDAAQAALRRTAQDMKSEPDRTYFVMGHTDLVGSSSYNERLGLRRAVETIDYLGSLGVARSRLTATDSMGESAPIVDVDHAERRNRRVEIIPRGTKKTRSVSSMKREDRIDDQSVSRIDRRQISRAAQESRSGVQNLVADQRSLRGIATNQGDSTAGNHSGHSGNPNGANSGIPSGGSSNNPSGGNPGDPSGGSSGDPSGGSSGNSSGGNSGNPSGGSSGNPSGGSSNNPNGGNSGNPSGGPQGNNGWGSGDQDAPGRSGGRNNAENGPLGGNNGVGQNSGNSGKKP